MNTKPKILIFIEWFIPGFKAGGPIKSVFNIVNTLSEYFSFYIITSDRDIGDKQPYTEVDLNKWIEKERYKIAYLSENERVNFIAKTLDHKDFSLIYFNSLYSKNYTLSPLKTLNKLKLDSKIMIAPRGMLGKGALKIKPFKKKIFLILTKQTGFFKKVIWHATDNEEIDDIKLAFGNKSIVIKAPNISVLNINNLEIGKKTDDLKLVFFSRISPKKNLKYTLERLNELKKENISMDIFGSIEDESYWDECREYIANKGLKVQYKGLLHPDEVNDRLSNYHFLFFPTLHENYGHVIVEALTAGCGLILSTNTPWSDLNRINVGWDIELENKEEFIKVIEKCYKMNQIKYNIIRNNCYNFITNEIEKQNAVALTKKMFLQ